MKEYQSTKDKSIILPQSVYHECIWIVRDMDRMKKALDNAKVYHELFEEDEPIQYGYFSFECSLELAEYSYRLECIERALMNVPPELREGILENICSRGSGYESYASESTWKRWKQRFIYSLANYLHLFGF